MADIRTPPKDENGFSWRGVVALEDHPTGDARMLAGGSVRWQQLPVPLQWVHEESTGHDGAVVVGQVLSVWREGRYLWAAGVFDEDSEEGLEAWRQVDKNLKRGVSLDLDDVDLELRITVPADDEEAEPVYDDDGRLIVGKVEAKSQMWVTTSGRMRGVTLVSKPSFAEAYIAPVDAPESIEAVTASRAARRPVVASGTFTAPRAWFDDPQLTGPTPLTVDDSGRVYGHVAAWPSCHAGFENECVVAPLSATGYSQFHLGSFVCDDGTKIAVGKLTMDTVHAGRRLSSSDAVAHYEHTGLVAALVRAGEDEHGIWVSGVMKPSLTEEQRVLFAASALSGDWREVGGTLELKAVLSVNTPGFPIPRALVSSGVIETLQSAGNLLLPKELVKGPAIEVSEVSAAPLMLKVRRAAVAARMRG